MEHTLRAKLTLYRKPVGHVPRTLKTAIYKLQNVSTEISYARYHTANTPEQVAANKEARAIVHRLIDELNAIKPEGWFEPE